MKKIVSLLLCFVLVLSVTSGVSVSAKKYVPKVTFIDSSTFKIRLKDEGEYYHEYYKILNGILYKYGDSHASVIAIVPENKNTKIVIPSKITCQGKDKTVLYISISSSFYKIENTPLASGKTLNNNISEIVIPNSVIGIKGLANVSSLKKVSFGKQVEEIENSFYGCKNLNLDIDNDEFYATGNELFEIDDDEKKLISVFKNPKVYQIPKEATEFEMPFGNNNKTVEKIVVKHNMESVNLEGLKSLKKFSANGCKIEELYFSENNKIKKLDLSKVKIKKLFAFGLQNLVSLKLPNGITRVNTHMCKKLEKINMPKSIKQIKLDDFGNTGFKTFNIPDSVVAIHPHAFSGSENLEKVTIPASVKTIRINLFQGCKKLEKIVLKHNKAPKIQSCAFESFDGLEFYVKNNKVADQLKTNLNKSGVKNAKIYVNGKLRFENLDFPFYF